MVRNDDGQLYTIEGVAAALIMLISIYLVMNATSIYTAGDTHIADMQLESLGSDALAMIDTATDISAGKTPLQVYIETDNATDFATSYLQYLEAAGSGPAHDIQYNATYICRNLSAADKAPKIVPITYSRELAEGEHPVRVTRWVLVEGTNVRDNCGGNANDIRAVLVEVLLWRD